MVETPKGFVLEMTAEVQNEKEEQKQMVIDWKSSILAELAS